MSDLLYLSCTILLPIIPAFLLFKALGSQGEVNGPLLGLKVKLGGAFAGYFAVLLLIFWMYNVWHPTYKVWKVEGMLTDEDGKALQPLQPEDVALYPSTYTLYPDGEFELKFAAPPGDYPRLDLSHRDDKNQIAFQHVTVVLDPKSPQLKDKGNSTLTLGQVKLHKSALPAYTTAGAPPAAVPTNLEPPPVREEKRP